jgi:hypothetical protein
LRASRPTPERSFCNLSPAKQLTQIKRSVKRINQTQPSPKLILNQTQPSTNKLILNQAQPSPKLILNQAQPSPKLILNQGQPSPKLILILNQKSTISQKIQRRYQAIPLYQEPIKQ